MNSGRHLLSVVAVAAVLFLFQPLIGVDGHEAQPLASLQGSPADLPGTNGGLRPVAPIPAGPDGRLAGEARDPVAGVHATRAGVWSSSPLSGPVKDAAIANFGVVEEGILYRSAQPSDSDMRGLLRQGFKSIVSFRKESGDHTEELLGLGFKNALFVNIEDETDPSDEQGMRFLDFVTDSENWPILIHCKVGLGRTGTMAALVRYAVDGWSMDGAIDEAKLYRGGIDLVPSQTAWLKRWAANHPPACHRPLTSQPN